MTLMDGKRDPIDMLQNHLYNPVRVWGVINTDTGKAEIRFTCRRCGDHGTTEIRQQADAFKNYHTSSRNGSCPHEKEVTY